MCFLPEVDAVVEVPGGSVAHDVTISRLGHHCLLPEDWRHGYQTQRREELLRQAEYTIRIITLKKLKSHMSHY